MNVNQEQETKKICSFCKKEATQICSACKTVAYCSREHQKQHWKDHKPQCRPFEVKHNQQLGRYLLCTRNIVADDTIINESPLVYGPKIAVAEPQCLGCYQPVDLNSANLTCPRCHWPVCSNICLGIVTQQHHAQECIVLSVDTELADNKQFCYEAITPLRCLLLQKKNPRKWHQLLAMESHFDKRQKGTQAYEESERIATFLQDRFLSRLENDALPDMSKKIIHVICGIIEVNALEVTTGKGEIIALYPTACIMEHSCISNTKYTFNMEDFKINVFASCDIEKNDHISTMYTHLFWGTEARQEHLQNSKYFTCKCVRCLDATELETHLSTIRCIGLNTDDVTIQCEGLLLPETINKNSDWKCNLCPVTLNSEHILDLMSRLAAQVDSTMENPNVNKLERLLFNLEKLVHKNHYHCFMANHSLIQLYGREAGYTNKELSDTLLERKIEKCKNLMDIINRLDKGHARAVLYTAVVLIELFSALFEKHERISALAQKQKYLLEGKDYLENCVHILRHEPCFSAGHSIINIAKGNLVKVKRELEKYKVIEL
ncbi:SET domain-containing protein SmydA-8-like [Rhodnius prolixus]|uniref:SET domain-containing protein SmydA-8-like n=1 Tax=Rhodnius prolixus TaxID=13249 RepID=UPI003D188000